MLIISPWKVRPNYVSAIKFVTIVTYSPVIFQSLCVAKFVAGLVDPNEPAQCSPRQKKLQTVSKNLLTVSKSSLSLRSNRRHLVCFYISKFLLTRIHMIVAPAFDSLRVTTTQNGMDFHLRGISMFSTLSRFPRYGRTFLGSSAFDI